VRPDDKVVLWGGGVYNWFDPVSLLYAIDRVRQTVPEVRLVFLGMGHPNPAIPEMRVAGEARALADSLGLTGTHVFFNEGWVPYDQRADVLLDADVAVSTHLSHIETRFSFRTRILDYLWAGLPMVLTEGDTLADLVARHGAGVTVPPGDVEGIAEGLRHMLHHPPAPDAAAALARGLRWEHVAAPLVEFCRSPRLAPDRVARDRVARAAAPRPADPSPPARQGRAWLTRRRA
jgi:glycosyltransferase involved in cell wall biosynthesis